jgi:sRNA-binding carbon storage regulator CsrA
MLVITRKCDESIVMRVPGQMVIKVTVVRVRGPKIRLGVVATDSATGRVLTRDELEVDREELTYRKESL